MWKQPVFMQIALSKKALISQRPALFDTCNYSEMLSLSSVLLVIVGHFKSALATLPGDGCETRAIAVPGRVDGRVCAVLLLALRFVNHGLRQSGAELANSE